MAHVNDTYTTGSNQWYWPEKAYEERDHDQHFENWQELRVHEEM